MPPALPSRPNGTVDRREIDRFQAMAADWWDPDGSFRPLHAYNPVRIGYIRDAACARFHRDATGPRPLDGLAVLDIGCGGGLVSEPLARLGARVTGIDAGQAGIDAARDHARDTGIAIDYRRITAEAVAAAGERFDIVVALEIVEHVADVALFLDSVARLTAPGGIAVLATLNRTLKALALAVVGAEYVLRWLPVGTHDWRRFRRPSELAAGLRAHGLTVRGIAGAAYDPVSGQFRLAPRDLQVNYMLWAARDA